MSLNFTEAMDTQVDDIEAPPLLPPGDYRWIVAKQPAIETSQNGEWDFVVFNLKCMGALDNVDEDDLAEFGDLTNVQRTRRFIFNKQDQAAFDRAMWELKQFVTDHLGVDSAGMTLKEMLPASVNQTCIGRVRWRPDRDNPERQYDEIHRTAPDE